jgi:hypothetical protein
MRGPPVAVHSNRSLTIQAQFAIARGSPGMPRKASSGVLKVHGRFMPSQQERGKSEKIAAVHRRVRAAD